MSEDRDTPVDRKVTIIDVYDELLATREEVRILNVKVDSAIRPVAFPRFSLWALVVAILIHAAVTR